VTDLLVEVESAVVASVTASAIVATVEVSAGVGGPQGPPGPPGPQGKWVSMTQAAYDALVVKDPDTLYVIIN
jgi:hypothetical protein